MWNKGIMLRHTSLGPRFQLDTMQATPEVQRREGREGEREGGERWRGKSWWREVKIGGSKKEGEEEIR
jgi:hypothetical protein